MEDLAPAHNMDCGDAESAHGPLAASIELQRILKYGRESHESRTLEH